MNHTFAKAVILLTATTYAGFAVWLGIWPNALLSIFEIETSTPAMLTEIRAFYGGLEIGIAVAMIVLWKRGNLPAALLVGGIPLAGSACGRCLGMLVDGYSSLHMSLAAIETLGFVICMLAVFVTSDDRIED